MTQLSSDANASPSRKVLLQRYGIPASPPTDALGRVVNLAVNAFAVPKAVVSFLDDEREWIQADRNFDRDVLPREVSFGTHAIQSQDVFVVEDAENDVRFAKNPLVTGFAGLRFYAGAPVVTPEGHPIGTVAVMDTCPRAPSRAQLEQLQELAAFVMDVLDRPKDDAPTDRPGLLPLNRSGAVALALNASGTILRTRRNWSALCGHEHCVPPSDLSPGLDYREVPLLPRCVTDPDVRRRAQAGIRAVLEETTPDFELVYSCHQDDAEQPIEMRVTGLDHPQVRALVRHQPAPRRQTEQQRRRMLETAVDQAEEVILVTESVPLEKPGPRITYVNPAFTEVTGYEPEEVIGEKTPRILQGPATEQWVLDDFREHLVREEPFEAEAINYRKSGSPYVNKWAAAPVYDDAGTLTHWVSVQRDVTEKRQMEMRLLRAQDLDRKRIAQTMHHEMGGLLTSLQMAVQSVQSGHAGTSAPLEEVKSLAEKLSTVVRSLTEELHSRVLDDYGLARALPRMADQLQEQHGLDVKVECELAPGTSLPPLVEKTAYLGIQKALTNVVQHADTDRAQVIVNHEPQTLRIHVIDDGVGFDPTSALDVTETLGLSSLSERIGQLNGKLDVNSAPGAGTRISMTLPRSLFPIRKGET